MIIDTETHVIYRVLAREWNPDQPMSFRPSWHEHSGHLLAAEMDRAGVDKTFLISYDADDIAWYFEYIGIEGDSADTVGGKKYTLETAVKPYPDRFLWFATLKHPEKPSTMRQLAKDLRDGALGIKIFPTYLHLAVDDPQLMACYRLIAEAGRRVILSFEETRPPDTFTVTQCFVQLDRVLTEFPDLQFQLNHAGAGSPDDRASDPLNDEARIVFDVTNRHANLWLSTAWLGKVWDDESEYPYRNYLRRLERLYQQVGVQRLLWATDWPWLEEFANYPQAVDSIRRHAEFFSEKDKALYLGENALRFIGDLLEEYPRAPIFQNAPDAGAPSRA
jgi:predicted TIM-barrel fold metal-dependent hydrolase